MLHNRSGDSEASARNVLVLDLRRLLGVACEVVGVPDHRFAGNLGVFAEELQSIDAGGGVVFLVGEFG